MHVARWIWYLCILFECFRLVWTASPAQDRILRLYYPQSVHFWAVGLLYTGFMVEKVNFWFFWTTSECSRMLSKVCKHVYWTYRSFFKSSCINIFLYLCGQNIYTRSLNNPPPSPKKFSLIRGGLFVFWITGVLCACCTQMRHIAR